jgi:hypothetical protein
MQGFLKRRRLLASAGAIGALIVAGGAYAYWSGTGGGSGSGAVGTSSTVALTATVTPGIAPGTAVPVSFTAANASASPIQVATVSLASVTVDAAHAACTTADFSMADVTETHQVPAAATAEPLPQNGSLVYANTAVSQDACKGATLTLNLTSQ